jgi:hypothetical protein
MIGVEKLPKGDAMTWTDFFVSNLPNGKTVVSPNGRPYVSMEIAPREYVEVYLTEGENELPFKVVFKRFDQIGGLLEEREYGQAGTKDLARKLAIDVASFRLNSFEFILDGE